MWSNVAAVRTPGPRLRGAAAAVLTLCPFLFLIPAQAQTISGLTFSQLNYELEPGSPVLNSDTGHLDIDLSAVPFSDGYLNIQTGEGWVVQNLPISSSFLANGYGIVGVNFDLGTFNSTPLSLLNATVSLGSGPSTSFGEAASSPGALVLNGNYLVGHDEYDNATGSGSPEEAGTATGAVGVKPPANAVTFNPGGRNALVVQFGHQNVQAADNQCVPAAIANELTWLSGQTGIPIPQQNIEGENGLQKSSLVAQLDVAVGRTVTDRADGKGVGDGAALHGTYKYLKQNGLADKITIQHQGTEVGDDNIYIDFLDKTKGIESATNGITVDPEFIYKNIAAGNTVGLGYTYDGSTHAHQVDVVAAGYILGAPFIFHQSDHLQTKLDPRPGEGYINDDKGTGRIDFTFLTGGDLANKVSPKLVDTPNLATTRFVMVMSATAPEPASVALFGSIALPFAGKALRRRRSARQ